MSAADLLTENSCDRGTQVSQTQPSERELGLQVEFVDVSAYDVHDQLLRLQRTAYRSQKPLQLPVEFVWNGDLNVA